MKNNKLFYGTWELDGVLKNIDETQGIELLKYAKLKGINKFDTALVYGNGKVEQMLSKIIDNEDIILTKVPAITKPEIDAINILDYYPKQYIIEQVKKSLKNLNKQSIDIVLLHNWSRSWLEDLSPLEELLELKSKGIIKNIGISLPNCYNSRLDDKILEIIDYIEAPYNVEDNWILKDIEYYKKKKVKIIIRSLFKQGLHLKEGKVKLEDILLFVNKLDVFITIGMTSKEQIDQNIKLLRGSNEK